MVIKVKDGFPWKAGRKQKTEVARWIKRLDYKAKVFMVGGFAFVVAAVVYRSFMR